MLLKPLFALLSAIAVAAELRVVPEPTDHNTGNTTLCLTPNFKIDIEGGQAPPDLEAAKHEVSKRLREMTYTYLSPTHGAEYLPCQGQLSRLVLKYNAGAAVKSIAEHAQERLEARPANEAYNLTVPVDGPAVITADTSIGLFRGLTTFENLFYAGEGEKSGQANDMGHNNGKDKRWNKHKASIYAPYAPYQIVDKPAFGWRAILLDSSRHYLPMDVIKRQLDSMAAVKLNVFHWYVSSLLYKLMPKAHCRQPVVPAQVQRRARRTG